jgi:hypothetical protein
VQSDGTAGQLGILNLPEILKGVAGQSVELPARARARPPTVAPPVTVSPHGQGNRTASASPLTL